METGRSRPKSIATNEIAGENNGSRMARRAATPNLPRPAGLNRMQIYLLIAGGVLAVGVAGTFVLSLTASPPKSLGVHDGKLAELPDTPNCVSTQTENPDQRMTPLAYDGSPKDALAQLREIVESMPRSRIVEQQDLYLRAEFRSAVFRFVDDVEFLVDAEAEQIHFRSASRVGHSDMGVNRDRMERIRERMRRKGTTTL